MLYRLVIAPPTDDNADEELRVLEWHRCAGEECAGGALLVEVETGKAVLEVRPARTVTLRKVFSQEGEWFKLGCSIAVLSEAPDEPLPGDLTELASLPMDINEL